MGIRKDRLFNKVILAKYILDLRPWKIGTDDGGVVTSKFLSLATGFRALCTRFFAVHGPTASNRPSCIELQAGWMFKAMVKIREEGIESVEPTLEAEKRWTEELCRTHSNSMMDLIFLARGLSPRLLWMVSLCIEGLATVLLKITSKVSKFSIDRRQVRL